MLEISIPYSLFWVFESSFECRKTGISVAIVAESFMSMKSSTFSCRFFLDLARVWPNPFYNHDSQEQYKGTLEVSQEVSGIKKPYGTKRLLDWE